MGDRDARAALEEAARLYEQYRRTYGAGTPTGADVPIPPRSAVQRVFETIGEPASRIWELNEMPGRAVAAVGTNRAGTMPPLNVLDVALYGRDMNTGRQPVRYGDVLAGTLEDTGEITPGGKAAAIIRAAGNLVTDPGAAPLLLSGAEAAGALAGRFPGGGGGARAVRPRPRGRSRLDPAYKDVPVEKPPIDVTATQPVSIMRSPTETQSIKPLQQNQPFGRHWKTPKLQEG